MVIHAHTLAIVMLSILAATPAAAVTPPAPEVARVYVWDRGGLSLLYCSTQTGELATACDPPAKLVLPIGNHRRALVRRVIERDSLDGSKDRVTTYRLPKLDPMPIIVVETRAGTRVWSGKLSKNGPNDELVPAKSPALVAAKIAGGKITVTTQGKPRTWYQPSLAGYGDPVVLGVFDLDRDGRAELVVLAFDDAGANVTVVEVSANAKTDLESDFEARVGG